jgi:threonine/homoserine/homoserine lactone efflux protein
MVGLAGALQVLLSGAALGVSIAAPPGPVTAAAVQRVAWRSWLSGWLVMAGATVSDGVFFVLTYFGVARLVDVEERGVLFVLGGVLMLYLAFATASKVRPALMAWPQGAPASPSGRSSFMVGLTMGLTNPYQLGWWVAIGASMVANYGLSIAAGFFAGIVCWTLVLTATVHSGVRRYQRLAPIIAASSAAVMAGFGLWFLGVGLSTTIF